VRGGTGEVRRVRGRGGAARAPPRPQAGLEGRSDHGGRGLTAVGHVVAPPQGRARPVAR
jgi:hypothetical protein